MADPKQPRIATEKQNQNTIAEMEYVRICFIRMDSNSESRVASWDSFW
jgi:hypothetical protein